jgi:hypothetical protein
VEAEHGKVLWRTRVPGPARHVAISPDGRTLWTALGTAASSVAVLDTSDARRPKLARTISPPFPAHDVGFEPHARAAWMTSGAERRVAIYRGGRRPARIIAAGSPPQHVTFAKERAFVASGDDGTVRRHRLDGGLVSEARVPSARTTSPSAGGGSSRRRWPQARRACSIARGASARSRRSRVPHTTPASSSTPERSCS